MIWNEKFELGGKSKKWFPKKHVYIVLTLAKPKHTCQIRWNIVPMLGVIFTTRNKIVSVTQWLQVVSSAYDKMKIGWNFDKPLALLDSSTWNRSMETYLIWVSLS